MLDGKIILVDDNEAVLKTLKMILAREFKTLVGVSVPTLLPALLREGDVDIVLLDMNFVTGRQDGSEGLFWLDRIVGRPDPPQVVLITAFGDIELAVSALKRGAADFVVKPWDNEKLVAILQGAFRRRRKVRTEAASMRRISAEEENGQVVSLLVGSLLKKYAQAYGKQLPVVTSGGLDKLSGLIRQGDLSALQQTIERAVLLTNLSSLGADDFHIEKTASASRPVTLEEMEKQFISEVLREKNGNLTLCAQQLDISRKFGKSGNRLEKVEERRKELKTIEKLSMTEIHKLADLALKVISVKVKHYAGLMNVQYGRITIRNQKTRWGSCSSKGNLNFNCLLMLAPDEVVDYVVIHELCHLIEMNHSKAFWKQVEQMMPDYKKHRKWLKDHGNEIMERMS